MPASRNKIGLGLGLEVTRSDGQPRRGRRGERQRHMARSVNIAPKGSRFVVLASVCIVVAALYFAQEVLIPLALAVLFCFLLTPLVGRLERFGLARVPSVMLVVTAAFTLAAALAWVVTAQFFSLADRLPDYETEIVHKVQRVHGRFAGGKNGFADKIEHVAQEIEQATTRPATQASSQPATVLLKAPLLVVWSVLRAAQAIQSHLPGP